MPRLAGTSVEIYAGYVDGRQKEFRQLVVQALAVAPDTPVLGQRYFDTALGYERICINATGPVWAPTTLVTGVVTNVMLAGSIALSKLATDPLARANHTGTQVAATISDFDTQVRTNRLDQMAAPTVSVALNSQRITGLGAGIADNDAATVSQVNAAQRGLDWKQSVRVATTANINLTTGGLLTIDGVTVAAGDRVLVKNQTTASQNGIYTAAAGAWTRAVDADTDAEVTSGMATFVTEGTTQGDQQWVLTTNDPITLGTTGLSFAQIGGGVSGIAGAGLTKTGDTFDVGAGPGISVTADAVAVDAAVVGRKATGLIGDGVAQNIAFLHSLGNQFPQVSVWNVEGATPFIVHPDIDATDTNTVTIKFGYAPPVNSHRVSVVG